MARQALPIVGQIVGYAIGGPIGGFIGGSIGSLLGNAIDPLVMQGNRIGDSPGTVAAEGSARAIVYGRGQITRTCIIADGDRRIVKKKEKTPGGKGGSPKVENEYVYRTFAIGLGEALPDGAILRIWQDETLVYDITPGGAVSAAENAKFAKSFRFYDGRETQLPDPDLQKFLGVRTPYFRGTAYVVFPQFDLTNTGERIPQFKFEVSRAMRAGDMAVYFALDFSGSMGTTTPNGQTRLQNMKTAMAGALDHIRDVLIADGSRVDIHVSGFSEGGSITRLNCTASDVSVIKSWMSGKVANGYTDFEVGVSSLASFFGSVPSSSTRVGFLITDGEPDVGAGPDIAIAEAARSHIDAVEGLNFYGINIDLANTTYTEVIHKALGAVSVVSGGDPQALIDVIVPSLVVGATSVGAVVAELLARSQLPATRYDVTAGTDRCVGVTIEETTASRDAIRSVLSPYFIDAVEVDGKIRLVKRGAPVVRTLTDDDLVEAPESQQRGSPIEYPKKLHFFFQSPVTGYAPGKATYSRSSPDARVIGEMSVSAPVAFDDPNEPQQIAEKWMKTLYAELGGEFKRRVPLEHIDLIPSDCVGIASRGQLSRARIVKQEVDAGTILLTLVHDRQDAVTSRATGIPFQQPTPPQPTIMSPTKLAVLDIPALTDADDDLHLRVAMTGATELWRGAQLQRSLDAGANYTVIDDVTGAAIMGELEQAVAAASPHFADTTNVVKVRLFDPSDEIDSLTDAQWLSEGGAFALQSAAGWELMQYRDAEYLGDGVYALTHLQRGRLNTAAVAHAPGALFVLLTAAARKHTTQSAWVGQVLTHRATSYSLSPEDGTVVSGAYTGASQREWPVAELSLSRDGDTVTARCAPRHRFGTDDQPVRSANWSGYYWTATDGTHTADFTTLDALHAFDVTGWSSTVSISVAQINRLTGTGPSVSRTIE